MTDEQTSGPQSEEALARVETGPLQFDDDWPGVFIRGDNAIGYSFPLEAVLAAIKGGFPVSPIYTMQCDGLLKLLRSATVIGGNEPEGLQTVRRRATRAAVAEAVEKERQEMRERDDMHFHDLDREVRAAVERELIASHDRGCTTQDRSEVIEPAIFRDGAWWHTVRYKTGDWARWMACARPEVWDRVTALREGSGS